MATQTQSFEETLSSPARRSADGGNGQTNILGMEPRKLASGLGWFSIGLGVTELLAPRAIARITGTQSNNRALIRGFGLREIASGVGILERPGDPSLVWSRVAGDALDLISLGAALASSGTDRAKTMRAIAAVAGVTVLDVLCAQDLSRRQREDTAMGEAKASLIIDESPERCYEFWRNLENLPQFMQYISNVRVTGENQSHWTAGFPGKASVEWDSELTEDIPNQRISWRSRPGSDVFHFGTVKFQPAPGGRGTVVAVSMNYGSPGEPAALFAKLVGKDPEQIMYKDLKRFKQVIETGEVVKTEGQSAGRSSGTTWMDDIAR